jgi:hypothetical protein
MTHRKITDRQKLFVREYMVDLNATQAAKKEKEQEGALDEPLVEPMSDLEFAQRILSLAANADRGVEEETEGTRAMERWLDRHGSE